MRSKAPRVLVVGGGPAGLATSLRLAAHHFEVTLADAKPAGRRAIGETVSGRVHQTLSVLGLGASFEQLEPRPLRVLCSAWGSAHPTERDSLLEVMGQSTHLDRTTFDAWLCEQAQAAGVELLQATRVRNLRRSGRWQAQLCHEGGASEERQFDVVVQAAGRQSALSRRLDQGRVLRWDRLVGVAWHIDVLETPVWRMVVEAISSGWLYFTPYGERSGVVAWLTDADLLEREHSLEQCFELALRQARHIPLRSTGPGPNCVAVYDARTAVSLAPVGDGYVMVGDAAASFDPLSSRGIETALSGGLRAADAIASAFRGSAGHLADYAQSIHHDFREYLELRRGYYDLERRFESAPFWARRHRAPVPFGQV